MCPGWVRGDSCKKPSSSVRGRIAQQAKHQMLGTHVSRVRPLTFDLGAHKNATDRLTDRVKAELTHHATLALAPLRAHAHAVREEWRCREDRSLIVDGQASEVGLGGPTLLACAGPREGKPDSALFGDGGGEGACRASHLRPVNLAENRDLQDR